jgi:hypothetical protein
LVFFHFKAGNPDPGRRGVVEGGEALEEQLHRVLFEVDGGGRATKLRLGSERDMETPGH